MKPILIIGAVLAFLISACAPKAAPTIDPSQVQASAVAAANTMVAETQAAMPSETPIPPTDTPTDTPEASPTIPPLPTSSILASPTVVASSGSGDCGGPLTVSKGETKATFKVNNKSKQSITVSFYLNKNAFGDCGYYSIYAMAPGSSVVVTTLPLGCYWISAISFGNQPFRNNAGRQICTGFNTDKFTVNITGINPIGVIAP